MDSNLIPSAVKEDRAVVGARDLTTDEKVAAFLSRLLPVTKDGKHGPVAALLPWVCDRLPSPHSRRAYASDLATFVAHMRQRRIDPLQVTGDDLRLYKAALLAAGQTTATVARALSVLRGTYQQFGKRGLLPWEDVRDIQSVESPVSKPGFRTMFAASTREDTPPADSAATSARTIISLREIMTPPWQAARCNGPAWPPAGHAR
jgi:hypothetical protein